MIHKFKIEIGPGMNMYVRVLFWHRFLLFYFFILFVYSGNLARACQGI